MNTIPDQNESPDGWKTLLRERHVQASGGRGWPAAAVSFALAVVFYVAAFGWIEHRRVAKGPWVIEFVSDAGGRPTLQISQRQLEISEELNFPDDRVGRPNVAEQVVSSEARTNLPFGEMLMQDALYLPGTVTMRVCGHQVEVLPRTLIVDKKEHAWRTGQVLVVGTNAGSP